MFVDGAEHATSDKNAPPTPNITHISIFRSFFFFLVFLLNYTFCFVLVEENILRPRAKSESQDGLNGGPYARHDARSTTPINC